MLAVSSPAIVNDTIPIYGTNKMRDEGEENVVHLIFGHNFRECRPILKILSLTDFQRNSLSIFHREFHLTWTTLPHYLVKFENSK